MLDRMLVAVSMMAAIPLTAIVFPSIGYAQSSFDFPKIDVEEKCKSLFQNVQNSMSKTYATNKCIDNEQAAYNALKFEWNSVSPKAQSYCLQRASKDINYFTYNTIEGCISALAQREEYERGDIHKFQP